MTGQTATNTDRFVPYGKVMYLYMYMYFVRSKFSASKELGFTMDL